jgi:hypothetical protein
VRGSQVPLGHREVLRRTTGPEICFAHGPRLRGVRVRAP